MTTFIIVVVVCDDGVIVNRRNTTYENCKSDVHLYSGCKFRIVILPCKDNGEICSIIREAHNKLRYVA
jgi:hypothetical protein